MISSSPHKFCKYLLDNHAHTYAASVRTLFISTAFLIFLLLTQHASSASSASSTSSTLRPLDRIEPIHTKPSARTANHDIRVVDDSGQVLTFKKPAQRAISLAPHLTNMMRAIGAEQYLVGALPTQTGITQPWPSVGRADAIDLERIVALQPDLILVWQGGQNPRQIAALRRLNIPLYFNEPAKLADIPRSLQQLATLFGLTNHAPAQQAITLSQEKLQQLQANKAHATSKPLRVFIQIGQQPLLTLNHQHLIDDMLQHCNAQNIFATRNERAPQISTEAVLQQAPDLILLPSSNSATFEHALKFWKRYPTLRANHYTNNAGYLALSADAVYQPSLHTLDATNSLCKHLQQLNNQR